ncbi:type II secretion system F family protein [Nitratireductor mangrovi]|uniref:Type II secretion system F family protein n=1 Tax=Nitratireductor mangrovi TaxID=2599600 RepID=A0A5B8KUD9_9HYPH|nr:type II secretion system F family protein [Nitratireductor mangrovi]QDY99169.1 type II secretion system F family protein [Nitratireductor mangrovi]
MLEAISPLHVIYATAALCAIMVAEAVYLLVAGRKDRRSTINRRMRLHQSKLTQEQVLIQLRKERGDGGRGSVLSLARLRDLRTQSGLTMPLPQFLAVTTGAAILAGIVAGWFGLPLRFALLAMLPTAIGFPVFVLRYLRKKRLKKFAVQLPEALELITRSLKAGHPVPVAIAMVAREMPDPIGTEFGMIADEVTYGSDLVTALNDMYRRVGHEDLPLFVTAVSIQSTTGGNLREILDGLANVIRDRGKLRRKVRSISTEGRMSAYILSALPVLLALAMTVVAPDMYGESMDEPLTWYLIGGTVGWLLLGNAVMFKMASFRF